MLKKSKSKDNANLLPKNFLTAFPWIVTVIVKPSDFLTPTRTFKPFADCLS